MPLTHWQAWLGIACGGAAGACARHAVAVLIAQSGATRWPLATFSVNVLGCFAAGLLVGWLAPRGGVTSAVHAMATVGFLGAFTTFSAFSVDTLRLVESGQLAAAASSVAANLAGALLAVFLGAAAARAFG